MDYLIIEGKGIKTGLRQNCKATSLSMLPQEIRTPFKLPDRSSGSYALILALILSLSLLVDHL